MPPNAVVAVGASAGGVAALRAPVSGLPAGFDGAVLVVLHIPRGSTGALPTIPGRSGPRPAHVAVDGEPVARQVQALARPPNLPAAAVPPAEPPKAASTLIRTLIARLDDLGDGGTDPEQIE